MDVYKEGNKKSSILMPTPFLSNSTALAHTWLCLSLGWCTGNGYMQPNWVGGNMMNLL